MTPEEQLLLARIRGGMDLCDSQHNKIGTVEKLYMGADYGSPPPRAAPTIQDPYMKANGPNGDLYIPSSSISEVTDECVVLKVQGDRLAQMGWTSKPDFIRD